MPRRRTIARALAHMRTAGLLIPALALCGYCLGTAAYFGLRAAGLTP